MAANKEKKLKKLLELHKPGTVSVASWLEKNLGISHDLQQHYRKSGWLESVGVGAFKRPGDDVSWHGGVYALQQQMQLPVHVGGRTALDLQGLSHYIRLAGETLFLFAPPKTTIPSWFKKHHWQVPVNCIETSVFPDNLGLIDFETRNLLLKIAAPERAILECLYLIPKKMGLIESYYIMEGLVNLRPKIIQELLEKCVSIKVKRLFLYMAQKLNYQWFKYIDLTSIDLGTGDRSIAKGGVYVSKFKIVVPRELVEL